MNKKQEQTVINSMNSNHNEIIALIRIKELPLNAMSEISDIKGQALIISAKTDNKIEIEELLIDLGVTDDFDNNMKEKIISLAMAIVSHNGTLDIE